MNIAESLECLLGALLIVVPLAGRLINKAKSTTPGPHQQEAHPAPPPAAVTPPSRVKRHWVLSSLVGAVAAFVATSLGSLAFAVWISLRPDMPPDIGEAMGYLAGLYICVGGPLISLLAAVVCGVAHKLFREFQDRDLRLRFHVAIGASLGLLLTLVPASLLLLDT